jgi:integrase
MLKRLSFERQLVIGKRGKVEEIDTPSGTHDWAIRDTLVGALHLRLTPGTMTWSVVAKVNGKVLRRSIANYQSTDARGQRVGGMDLSKARQIAKQWHAMMGRGLDPFVVRNATARESETQRERARMTLSVAYAEYMEARRAKSRDSTIKDRLKIPKWMVGSPIWQRPVVEIDEDVVSATFEPLLKLVKKEQPSKRPAWGPETISIGTLNKMYAYTAAAYARSAKKLGVAAGRGLGPFVAWRGDQAWPAIVVRETLLETETNAGQAWLRELIAVRDRAHAVSVDATVNPNSTGIKPYSNILLDYVLCLLLWGTRKSETALLREQDVDLDQGVVRLRAATTKSKRDGVIPITIWAGQILRQRMARNAAWRRHREEARCRWRKANGSPKDEVTPWLFPSRERSSDGVEKPLSNPRGVLVALNALTELNITPHDLRRTMATALAATTSSREDVGQLLLVGAALHHHRGPTGSVPSAATERYVQKQADILRPAYQEREDYLRGLVGLPVLGRKHARIKSKQTGFSDQEIEAFLSHPAVAKRVMERLQGKT